MPIQPPAKSLTSPWGLRSFSPCTDSSHKLLYEIFVNNILCLNKIFTWFGKTCIVHTSNFEHFKIYKSQRMDKELKWDRNGGPKALVSFKSRLFKVEKLDVWTVYACTFFWKSGHIVIDLPIIKTLTSTEPTTVPIMKIFSRDFSWYLTIARLFVYSIHLQQAIFIKNNNYWDQYLNIGNSLSYMYVSIIYLLLYSNPTKICRNSWVFFWWGIFAKLCNMYIRDNKPHA